MKGDWLDVSQLDDCDPIKTVSELGIFTTVSGKTLKGTDPANPCGLVAKSYFTD